MPVERRWGWPEYRGALTMAVVAGAVGFGTPGARAASFDCAKAVSPMEKAICSDKSLGAQDEALAAAYRQAIALLPAESVETLRVDQRSWLVALERGCQIAAVAETAKNGKPVDVADSSAEGKANLSRIAGCMKAAYTDRIDVLKHAYATVDGVVFLTRSVLLLSPDRSPDGTGELAANGPEVFPGFGSLQASWPEAQSTDPRWVAWNRAVADKLQSGLAVEAKAVPPGWHDSMAAETDSTVVARTPEMRQGRVSVAIAVDTMGHGAAHPNEQFATFTWMLDARRAMTARDVFKQGSAWKTALAAYAWKDLSHGENSEGLYDREHGARSKALLDAVSDVDNWTVTPRGLILSWPEYSVTPRAYPMEDTVVPWATLRDVLAQGFVP